MPVWETPSLPGRMVPHKLSQVLPGILPRQFFNGYVETAYWGVRSNQMYARYLLDDGRDSLIFMYAPRQTLPTSDQRSY